MNKATAHDIGVDQARLLHRVFNRIIKRLVEEGHSKLPHFGMFEIKRSKPVPARNPRTGQSVLVPGRSVVTFKPSREMEEKVQRYNRDYHAVSV
jgi:nucleoid DNA-binding protein